jgi:hypothetical protein
MDLVKWFWKASSCKKIPVTTANSLQKVMHYGAIPLIFAMKTRNRPPATEGM